MERKKLSKDEPYSEEETVRRREATLKRMLSTPPKPHDQMKLGKRKPISATVKSAPKHKKAMQGNCSYSEPMIMYDIHRFAGGRVEISDPYLLLPDGKVAALSASLK